jgi:hypothetical protein
VNAKASAVVMLFGFAVGQKALDVKLAYVPQDTDIALTNPLPPSIIDRPAEIRVDDARVQPESAVIGEGNAGDKLYQIRAVDEPVKYLRETLLRIAATQGLASPVPANRQFRIRVVRFWISHAEKVVGAKYAAEVSLAYGLTDKAGSTLAEGTKVATATHYGRGRSPDNCNEVLSDALKEAFLKVLDDQKLRDAWKAS